MEEDRVSFLDPDFILIFLFAVLVDSFDMLFFFLGFLDLFTLSTMISISIDFFVFSIIGSWMYWRMNRIEESKRARQAALRRATQKAIQRLDKLQRLGKVSPKVFERYMRRYSQRMGRLGRLAARAARSPIFRVLIRGLLIILGEVILLIGLIPFWTISVVLMLREK